MTRRRFVALCGVVVVAGVAMLLPSLDVGFYGDDYFHQLVLRGETPPEVPTRPWNLYDFGDTADWRAPARYLANLGVLLSSGLLRLVAPVSLDLAIVAPWVRVPQAIAGMVVVWPLTVVLSRRLRAAPEAWFLGLWTLLSLAPEAVAPPWDRLLFQAAVGSAGMVAMYVHGVLGRSAPPSGRAHRALAWTLVASAGVLSVLYAATQPWALLRISRNGSAAALATGPGPPTGGTVDAVVLQATNGVIPFILPATWAVEGDRQDVRFSALQLGRRGLEWTREGDRTCLVRSLDEPFLEGLYESVYRTEDTRLHVGDVMSSALFTVEVAEIDDGLRSLRLTFSRSMDAPDLRFLAPVDGVLAVVPPPRPGETIVLEQPAFDPLL